MKLLHLAATLLAAALATATPAFAATPGIVAAENVYGDIAQRIAGPQAQVTSILTNPDQDPHLFEASASTARALSAASLVIVNGADYDPWMDKLLAAAQSPGRRVIDVASLLHRKPGSNPHIWYDPTAIPAVANAIATALEQADPANQPTYAANLAAFLATLQPLQTRVAALHARFAGTPVTATEPVFGEMATALGLTMRNERFQLAVMNDTEPSASDTAAFERDLKSHKVKLLVYNSQATDAAAERLLKIAKASHVPVIGVTETQPANTDYAGWMLGQLGALEHALGTPSS